MKANKKLIAKALLSEADLQAIGDLMGGLMDKQAAVLASKQDLKDEIGSLETRMDSLETRMDVKLNNLETNLEDYMHQGFESVMEGMDAISEKLAEKEKVERLVAWAKEVGEKVGIKPKIL
jgi:hypothetical protein